MYMFLVARLYPSSVIMTAIPAKIAKVPEVSIGVPCPKGYLNPSILVAAKVCGRKKYKIGGAQAIAAMWLMAQIL